MKYMGMPFGMWILFQKSFRMKLKDVLGYSEAQAKQITVCAHQKFKEIIAGLPDFEKGDRFMMNIVSCAMFSSFILNMNRKPTVDQMTEFYKEAMMTPAMKWFCRKSGKNKFTDNDIESLKKTAAFRAADRNQYSWNMDFLPYEDGSGYEARFTACGICTLMKELGIHEYIPAMCRLDYTMSEAGGASEFVREYTLADGGPYCDCGYLKK